MHIPAWRNRDPVGVFQMWTSAAPNWCFATLTLTASTGLAPTRAAAGLVSKTYPEWVQEELCVWRQQRLQVQQLLF